MSEKNGGPYTKPEQEERRRKVYEMHFEKSLSALKIAEALDVNRNTINDDIRYWYSELACEFDKTDIKDLFLRQYHRMESQRARLETLLEKQQDVHMSLKIERMIYDLDRAIAKIIVPIAEAQKSIPEKEALDVAEHLLLSDSIGKNTAYSERHLLQDIIEYKKCDVIHAQKTLDKIKGLGLSVFDNRNSLDFEDQTYDLLGFAEARNLLSDEDLQKVYSKIEQRESEQRQEIAEMQMRDKEREAELLKQFTAKYGDMSGWSPGILRDYYYDLGIADR